MVEGRQPALVVAVFADGAAHAVPDAAPIRAEMAHHPQAADAAAGVASEIEHESRTSEIGDGAS